MTGFTPTWLDLREPVDAASRSPHLAELPLAPLSFRHIARAGASGEVSGHYHPKASVPTRGGTISRPAFLADRDRVILPSFTWALSTQRPPQSWQHPVLTIVTPSSVRFRSSIIFHLKWSSVG